MKKIDDNDEIVEVLNNGEENDNNIEINDKRINLRDQDMINGDFSRQSNHVDNNNMFDQNSILDENENSILDQNNHSSIFYVNDL